MYEKPKCECGKKLVYRGLHVLTLWGIPITKNGDFSKKKSKSSWQVGETLEEPELACEYCGLEYSVDYDKKGRIIRGDIKNDRK